MSFCCVLFSFKFDSDLQNEITYKLIKHHYIIVISPIVCISQTKFIFITKHLIMGSP